MEMNCLYIAAVLILYLNGDLFLVYTFFSV